MVKKILFVCKHNRFRSKIAEAFFNKLNKNKEYIGISAGLLPGHYPLDKLQAKIALEYGLHLRGKPKAITTNMLKEMSIFVIVADDVPPIIFNNKKYGREEYIWKVPDADTEDEIRESIKIIKKHVEEFLKGLK